MASNQPLIVYFPDFSQWLSRAVPKTRRKEFVDKVQEMFDKLSGPIVMICGQNKIETGSKEREKFVSLSTCLSLVIGYCSVFVPDHWLVDEQAIFFFF